MNLLLILGLVFGALAAILHVVIFVMESVLWTRPAIWKRFGLSSEEEAQTIRPMALNQGFYNLFLAVGAAVGVVLLASTGGNGAGYALAFLSLGSMLAASLVLLISNPRLARAAATQGVAPLIAIVLLAIACISS
jgi:putative membrane protein